ncbi:MAG: MFS transporter [Opitutaceae bacterium]|nr:MFS transporter [Opitutaceae bacterium]
MLKRLNPFPTQKNDPELHPYRHGLHFSFFNALNWQIGIGTPMVLFMEQLGASSFQVGLAYAFTFLLTPVQVVATAWLPRYGFKRLTLLGWGLRGWFLIVPVVLAVWGPAVPPVWTIYAFVAAMFCYNLSRCIGVGAIVAWMLAWVPEPVRGRYFAMDQLMSALASVTTLGVSSLMFAALPAYTAFSLQYLSAGAGAWLAYRCLVRVPDVARPGAIDLRKVLVETPRLMLRRGSFRHYLWMAVWFMVISTPMSPFTAYYLKAGAGLTPARIVLFTIMQYLGVIAGTAFMRTRIDRTGARPFFLFSLALYALLAVGWWGLLHFGAGIGAVPGILYFLMGMGSGCWNAANMNYLAKLLPEQERALPVALHAALTSFMGGVATVLWGGFLKGGAAPSVDVVAFQVFFGVTLVSTLVLFPVVACLKEKTGAVEPLIRGESLLRPFRGVTYLASLFLAPPPTRPPDDPAR